MKQLSFLVAWLGMGFLGVCLFSGLALAFAYYPHAAFESVSNLKNLPFGLFFRKLHYFSGELFLIFSLAHVAIETARNSKDRLFKFEYISGILALIAAFVLMFGGYVLKGDLNGLSAAQVAFALILDTPVLDNFISLFRDFEWFFWRFFVLHAIILPAALLYFLKIHAKKIFTRYFLVALAASFLALAFLEMPRDLNPLDLSPNVGGPWFFAGAERALVLGANPALVASFLAAPFALLAAGAFAKKPLLARVLNLILILWVGVYAYFCFV